MLSNVISLVFRDINTDSEDVSLIWRSVSYGQNTCSIDRYTINAVLTMQSTFISNTDIPKYPLISKIKCDQVVCFSFHFNCCYLKLVISQIILETLIENKCKRYVKYAYLYLANLYTILTANIIYVHFSYLQIHKRRLR